MCFKGVAGVELRLYTVLKKSRGTVNFIREQQKFCRHNVQMTEYNKVNVKWSDSQANKKMLSKIKQE